LESCKEVGLNKNSATRYELPAGSLIAVPEWAPLLDLWETRAGHKVNIVCDRSITFSSGASICDIRVSTSVGRVTVRADRAKRGTA
jgi:hypothetical protein